MELTLTKAAEADCPLLHEIQIKSFTALLEKYRDFATNPAAEGLERIEERFYQDFTDYYLICLEDMIIGMMRVCDFGDVCRLSPLCILPDFQGRGYAQRAMLLAEARYPEAKKWELDTIAQEPKLRHLYEKMGYRKTGKFEHIQDDMDLVFFEKEVKET